MNTKCVYLAAELTGALGLPAALGFGSALGLAGALGFGSGAVLGLAASGAAIVASVPNGTDSTLISGAGAASTLGAGVSTLYGASDSEGFPRKNSLIFVNIMFLLCIYLLTAHK